MLLYNCSMYPFLSKLALFNIFINIYFFGSNSYCDSILVPTFFGKKNADGSYVDADSTRNWLHINSVKVSSNATLKVVPSLVSNGGYVTVSWSGVMRPTPHDIIAFYCPTTAKNQLYIDFVYVDVSPSHMDGNGRFTVRLYNLRTSCEFRYHRNTTSLVKLEEIAISNTVMFQGGPEQPLQIHLALTGDPTQMRVMWVSGTDEVPIVKYNVDGDIRSHTVEGTTKTYKEDDLCYLGARMFNDPGFIHDVLLTNLKPSTVYNYSCGVSGHMSELRSFKTAPNVGSDIGYKFIAYADMGIINAGIKTAEYSLKDVLQDGYEFVFHPGDLSYAFGFGYIWDQWFSLIEPYASKVPYMVGVGNHEQNHVNVSKKDPSVPDGVPYRPWWGNYENDGNGECGVPMYYRFHMPDNGNYVWWYSYNYGMVHFIMMSTEHDMAKGSPQYTWLENDLKNIDRTKTPWVILGGHRPMYASQIIPDDFAVSIAMQVLFEDLLHEYKVDMALWGHYHSYERTCAVYKCLCRKDGIVHIIIGTAGRKEDWPPFVAPWWSQYHRHCDSYGYGRVTVANRSALHWEYFVTSEKKVVDDVWLFKETID